MATTRKKTNEIPEKGIIIQNIDVRPVVRQSNDISKWRQALQYAEAINGNRVQLYDLYEEIMLDGTLKSLIAKRILGVTKTRLKFVDKEGKEVPEIMDLLSKKAFRDLRKAIMNVKFWGVGVIELMKEGENFKIFDVPKKHIRPKEGWILKEQYGSSNADTIWYREKPNSNYLLDLGSYKDLGLILEACQYVIYKRGAFGDWAKFAEIFGMPFREARYDGYNQEVRRQLETALESMGSAGYAILPTEAKLTLHQAANTQASGELYNTLRKACNDELAVLILGQTETTTSSSSSGYAQSQTHAAVEAGINHDDKEDELAIMNEQVKQVLKNLGYRAEGIFVHEPEAETISLKDKVEILDTVRNKLKTPVEDDYVYEITGTPKPKNYDALKAEQANSANPAPPEDNNTDPEAATPKPAPKKKKKPAENLSAGPNMEEAIKNALNDFFRSAHGN